MTSPPSSRGGAAEREAAQLIAELTGHPARRKLGAGRADDTGDIDGVPDRGPGCELGRCGPCRPRKPTGAELQRRSGGDVRLHVGAVPWRPLACRPDP